MGLTAAGAFLGLSKWTVRDLIAAGKLRRVQLPGVNRVLLDRLDLEALVEAGKR